MRPDGKIEELWQPTGQIHHFLYAVGVVLALIAFWPLGIVVLFGWAVAASHTHDKYYVIKSPSVESSGKKPKGG